MNKEFRNLVEKEEFWKDIPDKYQWVAVDGPSGAVFTYEGEPLRYLVGLHPDEWFDENVTQCYIIKLSPGEPDKIQRPTFSEKTDPDDTKKKYRIVIEDVTNTIRFSDVFELTDGQFEKANEKLMNGKDSSLLVKIEGKDVRFVIPNLINFYLKEV